MKHAFICLTLLVLLCGGLWAQLDTTTFVVLGEDLAAGTRNFSLSEVGQKGNFAALAARQVGAAFPQPIFQSPGVGNVVGFPELPVRVPTALQTTLRSSPPDLFVFNLSVPGFTVEDAVSLRPKPPLIHSGSSKQTTTNLILGFPAMLLEDEVPMWSQIEYAEALLPTVALVELGFQEVLGAAVNNDPGLLPDVEAFRANYSDIVSRLRSIHSEVVVATIPDPIDTAYFSDPFEVARLNKSPVFVILGLYDLDLDDHVTVQGQVEIGGQFIDQEVKPLSKGSVMAPEEAQVITDFVETLNEEIRSIAQSQGALVWDLHAFFEEIDANGVTVGGRQLTGEFLGGIYSLNGFTPGDTGNALIANDLLQFLNASYNESFPLIDVETVLDDDAVGSYRIAGGPDYSLLDLEKFVSTEAMARVKAAEEEYNRRVSTSWKFHIDRAQKGREERTRR